MTCIWKFVFVLQAVNPCMVSPLMYTRYACHYGAENDWQPSGNWWIFWLWLPKGDHWVREGTHMWGSTWTIMWCIPLEDGHLLLFPHAETTTRCSWISSILACMHCPVASFQASLRQWSKISIPTKPPQLTLSFLQRYRHHTTQGISSLKHAQLANSIDLTLLHTFCIQGIKLPYAHCCIE